MPLFVSCMVRYSVRGFSGSNPPRVHCRRLVVLGLALTACVYAQKFPNGCTAPQYPSAAATKIDSLCGPKGIGSSVEQNQNSAKNNFCPTGTSGPIAIADLASLQQKVQLNKAINFGNFKMHPFSANPGPTTNRAPLVALGEGKPVVLQGFILVARQESVEDVNCGTSVPNNPASYDIHVTIADSAANRDECSAVVVEMSPHHRPANWNLAEVQAVAGAHLPVRVTGQLFFDSSHSPCQNGKVVAGDPARVSLWEIHPIYQFEVCTQGDCASGQGWTPLLQWKPPLQTPRKSPSGR
jgi:hypothetical protein